MTGFLGLSSWIYAAALPLFPPELRRDFGTEIAQAFEEDLEDAWRSRGAAGVMRVWLCAGREIVQFAFLSQAEKPVVAVPFLSFVLCASIWSSPLMLALSRKPVPFLPACWLALMPSLITALVSFIAVRTGSSSAPVSLRLK